MYCSKRLCFGLFSGPRAFQAIINKIIDGIPGTADLLDDSIVSGSSMAELDERLRCELDRTTNSQSG